MTVPEKYQICREFDGDTSFSAPDYYYKVFNRPVNEVKTELKDILSNHSDWLKEILELIDDTIKSVSKKKWTATNTLDVYIDQSDCSDSIDWNVSVTAHAYREMSEKQKLVVDHKLKVKAARDAKATAKKTKQDRKNAELDKKLELALLDKLKKKYEGEEC